MDLNTKAIALLRGAVNQWAGRFKTEEDINGADAVDWLGEFITDAQKILRRIDNSAENSKVRQHMLTEQDASEIYDALDAKRRRIEAGDYGAKDPDLDPAEWAAHLGEIMAKIGPDGCCLIGLEFDGEGDDDAIEDENQ